MRFGCRIVRCRFGGMVGSLFRCRCGRGIVGRNQRTTFKMKGGMHIKVTGTFDTTKDQCCVIPHVHLDSQGLVHAMAVGIGRLWRRIVLGRIRRTSRVGTFSGVICRGGLRRQSSVPAIGIVVRRWIIVVRGRVIRCWFRRRRSLACFQFTSFACRRSKRQLVLLLGTSAARLHHRKGRRRQDGK